MNTCTGYIHLTNKYMRILLLTQVLPYPPDAGPKVKTWHLLRYLHRCGHQVILASFVRPDEIPYIDTLRQYCEEVHPVPIRRSRWVDLISWARSNVTGRPFLVERDDLPEMRKLVGRLMSSMQIDAIHADQLTMTQFGLPFIGSGKPFLTFDAHNAVWTIIDRMAQTAPRLLRPAASLESKRIKRYEGKMVHSFDQTLAVTEPDQQALCEAEEFYLAGKKPTTARITTIPITIDTAVQTPIRRVPGSQNIVTLGTLHYPPNADGIRWFLNEVFPLVLQKCPQATLTIIGKNPPRDFLETAESSSGYVKILGYVPDLVPHFEQSALMVVPVRAGGGMRVRILEAFAWGMPVVTTTVGVEGISAVPGRDLLVEDTTERFAAAVVRLLNDPRLQTELSIQCRKLAEEKYDWLAALSPLGKIYGEVAFSRVDTDSHSHPSVNRVYTDL